MSRPVHHAAVLCALLALGSGSAGAKPGRAIWVWEPSTYAMLDDEDIRADAISFLVSRGFTTAYVYGDAYRGRNPIVETPEKYAALIRDMHLQGIRVHALLGSAHLLTQEYVRPEKRSTAMRMLAAVLDYNEAQPPEMQFDGVTLDIEPYLLKQWKSNRKAVAKQYLELSAAFMELKESRGAQIPIGTAMPFWYDRVGKIRWNHRRKLLHRHVQNIYDYVAIMDYRDFADGSDGLIAHAQAELKYGQRIRRGVVVGVETGRSSPEKVTFREEGPCRMEAELRIAERAFRKYQSFEGFAIHHFRSYRELTGATPLTSVPRPEE